MIIPCHHQDTRYLLSFSNYVTSIDMVAPATEQFEWETIYYYQVTSSDKHFDVKIEEPIERDPENCIATITYLGRDMFRANIREVSKFFDIVGRTLSILA